MEAGALPPGIERHGRRYRVVKRYRGTLLRTSFTSLREATASWTSSEAESLVKAECQARIPLTVGDLVERWFLGHRNRLQPGTQFDYEWRICHDISKIADVDARDLVRDPSILHDFYWNQLGPQSARNARTILLQAFQEAVMRN